MAGIIAEAACATADIENRAGSSGQEAFQQRAFLQVEKLTVRIAEAVGVVRGRQPIVIIYDSRIHAMYTRNSAKEAARIEEAARRRQSELRRVSSPATQAAAAATPLTIAPAMSRDGARSASGAIAGCR